MAPATLESNSKYILFSLLEEKSEAAVEINVGGPDRLTPATLRSNLSPGDNNAHGILWRLTTLCSCL